MPKLSSFPPLLDQSLQISITKLNEWGYLNSIEIKCGTITWSNQEIKTGSISICFIPDNKIPLLILDYQYGGQPRCYKIELVSIPSNLGKGLIWYFLCPATNKRSRKLYSIDGYFYHREAFNGCMYECQTQSKNYREIEKTLGAYFRIESLYTELHKKHLKKTYAGKPTKKYSRIIEQIEKAESIPYYEIERLMIKKR